jgi:hypothetical protein
MILKGLTSEAVKDVFLAIAEHYVKKTTNTFDDDLLVAVRQALKDEK